MVKSKEAAKAKMADRVSTAGRYLTDALKEAPDPLDVILEDPEGHAKKLEAGVKEAIRTGKLIGGIKKAKERDSWKKSLVRAGEHYEERTGDMVEHAMEDYDVRAGCIETAKKVIKKMAKATRADRIKRSAKYQEEMGKCMDRAKGRTG